MAIGEAESARASSSRRRHRNYRDRLDALLVWAAVAASFLSRLFLHLGPFKIRPEFVIDGLVFLRVLPSLRRLAWRRLAAPGLLLLFVLVNVVSTVLFAPSIRSSFATLMWLFLDAALLAGLMCLPEQRERVLRAGATMTVLVSASAIVLWVLAAADVAHVGVQREVAQYGGYASFVLSYEANI